MNYCLIHKDDPCFPLLEGCIGVIQLQMRNLTEWLHQSNRPRSSVAASVVLPTSDEIKLQIPSVVTTGWHRQDLITLTETLVRIRRSMDVLAHRLEALELYLDDLDLALPMELLEKAVDKVSQLVSQLRDVTDLTTYQVLTNSLVEVRGAMDKARDEMTATETGSAKGPLKEIARQELLKAFDDAIESCEQAGHHIYKLALSFY
ncbi:MAG TPA: hypothetical protein P5186_06715 [Candidatus Paceibacterota bacterium]|nr:hypothetical protein [Verrucomicrobiota bacterium]HRY47721.1 hypothetical protein [Candidatus Paceibacterota bacterium]HSA01468.1 hypothetical protein [Candidatus Paceibacterota bacterium]